MSEHPKDPQGQINPSDQRQNQGRHQNQDDRNREDNTVLKRMNGDQGEDDFTINIPEEVPQEDREWQTKSRYGDDSVKRNQDDQNGEDNTVLARMNGDEDETDFDSEDKDETNHQEKENDNKTRYSGTNTEANPSDEANRGLNQDWKSGNDQNY